MDDIGRFRSDVSIRSILVSGRVSIVLDAGNDGTVAEADDVSPYDTTVGIRFNTDGTVETGKSVDGAAITWSAAGEWIDPNAQADSTYSVRFTNFNGASGGDWTTEAAADDAWIGLGSQRVWLMNSTSFETISFTTDFEVRRTSGAPPATGSSSYTFQVLNIV